MENQYNSVPTDVATKFLILINDNQNGDIQGQWCSMCKETKENFSNFIDLYKKVDDFFNQYGLVQRSNAQRSFLSVSKRQVIQNYDKTKGVQKFMENKEFETNNGEKATFMVQVLYRQNSTWQGSVKWIETNEETNFRSAMELMQIIDGALKTNEKQ